MQLKAIIIVLALASVIFSKRVTTKTKLNKATQVEKTAQTMMTATASYAADSVYIGTSVGEFTPVTYISNGTFVELGLCHFDFSLSKNYSLCQVTMSFPEILMVKAGTFRMVLYMDNSVIHNFMLNSPGNTLHGPFTLAGTKYGNPFGKHTLSLMMTGSNGEEVHIPSYTPSSFTVAGLATTTAKYDVTCFA